jgi:hypothetical protein
VISCSSLIGDEKMAKLRLSALNNDKPVKVSVELPATVHRDLAVYAEILARQTGEQISDPNRLIAQIERLLDQENHVKISGYSASSCSARVIQTKAMDLGKMPSRGAAQCEQIALVVACVFSL